MILIELIYNLALLVALSVVSGFIDTRWKRSTRFGEVLQGVLFGGAAMIGMLRPFVFAPGLVFDGRSVMISLGGLFFGPWTAAVTCLMTIPLRLALGGPGVMMGVLVILSSAAIGAGFHARQPQKSREMSAAMLFGFGLVVHLAMLAMTVVLPPDRILPVLKTIGWPVMLTYPLATVLIGKILSDQVARHGFLASLQESEERYRELVEHANSVILRMTPDGTITFFNEFAQRFFGFTPPEILGRNVVGSIVPATDTEGKNLASMLRDLGLHPERYLNNENENVRKDGTRCRLAWTNRGILDEQGRCVAVLCVGTDITERKRTEEALRESHDMIVKLTSQVPGVVYQYRLYPDGRSAFPFSSRGMNDIYEVTPEEVREDATPVFGRLHPDDYEHIVASIQESARTNQPFHCEFRVVLPRQGLRWRLSDALPERMEDGGTLWHGIISDITERKLAEAEKAKLEAQFQQAQKMESVGQLAGGVAHDFNNILAAIMMRLGYLQWNTNLDEETRESLKELTLDAQRAATLTRQLLMFSRRSVLEIKVLDLNEVVANLLKMLGRLIGEHISLRFDRQEALPAVEADPGMMEQVVMNFCVNARDAMPKGGKLTIGIEPVQVDAELVEGNIKVQPGPFVCLSVADTGCGMDEATRKRIFEPFFTTKEIGKGTGLGLAIVHGIVAQHKGWVEVESELGKGTVFKVFVPATTKWIAEPAETEKMAVIRGHEMILLVEDEVILRQMLSQSLRSLGYQVLEADNGQTAMMLWQEHGQQIDLLYSDMVMPEGMTGLDLAEKLKGEKPNLKVIISSGYNAEMAGKGGPTADGIVYLQKPYPFEVLSKSVRDCLDRA